MSKQRKVDKKMTTTNTNEDKLILGGHEFTSIVSRQVYRQSLRQLVNLHHRLQLSHCYP